MSRTQSLEPIPLRPDAVALRERNIRALARACVANIRGKTVELNVPVDKIVRRIWPHDEVTGLIVRASTSSTTLTSADALVHTVVADLIAAMAPVSAGGRLLEAGLQLSFDNAAYISVPSFQALANSVSFTAEDAPIPVRQLTSRAVRLEPHKLISIIVLTEETIASSNAELMVRDLLTRSVGLSLDQVLFDANPGNAIRPAGLRYGIGATPATIGSDPFDSMVRDLGLLAAQVAPIGGPIYFIAAPDRAIRLKMRAHYELTDFTVLPSVEIAPDQLICVAVNGLVSATDQLPQIWVSREATLHMDDVPLPIADSSGTLATPVTSLWQSASVGLNLRFEIDWGLRAPAAVAWMSITEW
jgi:hypothetical protein